MCNTKAKNGEPDFSVVFKLKLVSEHANSNWLKPQPKKSNTSVEYAHYLALTCFLFSS